MYRVVTNLYLEGKLSFEEAVEMLEYLQELQIRCCVNCDEDAENCKQLGKFNCNRLMEVLNL